MADMERSAMNGDSSGKKPGDSRTEGVSLFRPGQPIRREPVTLDQATGREIFAAPNLLRQSNPDRVWDSLTAVALDATALAGNGLFVNSQPEQPAASAFDILRTRLLQAMAQRGWKRIAVTSPTHGCGKSFVAANLALSLARMPGTRTVLVDLELRKPGMAALLGIKGTGPIRDLLTGDQPLESHLQRVGRNLALALNGTAVADAAELLHEPDTAAALEAMLEQLDPAVAIYDLPPALGSDDVITMLPQVDAVLLVADGTRTTAEDVRACERLFEGRVPLMGVVLNRSQDRSEDRYRYGRK
ncbi:CpsD/CapB family tyrosine-protein kinase [Rhodobacter ferrooxidans]|nr:CpsD/CapB family tyrosine-protein kinase [Rhodobacter sp. SW2]